MSMIKRSALLKGVIIKLLGDTKLVRTLVGRLKMQEFVRSALPKGVITELLGDTTCEDPRRLS